MRTLAVTGGIGSGKSYVCSLFAQKGIPVYDSDSKTKDLYDGSVGLASALKELFGDDLYTADGRLDRKALARHIFNDAEKLRAVEALVHPLVHKDFVSWRDAQSGAPFVILESAIILDKPLFRDIIDKVLVVDAPVRTRIHRAATRDGVSEETVSRRVARQMTDYKDGADYLLINDGTEEDLKNNVNSLFTTIYNDFKNF